jgi:hypothetical protein
MQFEEAFRNGFSLQNSNSIYIAQESVEVRSNKPPYNHVGDIDYYVQLRSDIQPVLLKDILPGGVALHDFGYQLQPGDHIFFELTTQEGNNIYKDKTSGAPSYIEKKISFHHLIQTSKTDFLCPSGRVLLILVFNGADSVHVYPKFQGCLQKYQVNGLDMEGTSVYASSDIVIKWEKDFLLQQEVMARIAAEEARIAAEEAAEKERLRRIALEEAAEKERLRSIALEEEIARLRSQLSQRK